MIDDFVTKMPPEQCGMFGEDPAMDSFLADVIVVLYNRIAHAERALANFAAFKEGYIKQLEKARECKSDARTHMSVAAEPELIAEKLHNCDAGTYLRGTNRKIAADLSELPSPKKRCSNPPKRRSILPKKITDMLKTWAVDHWHNCYPSDADKKFWMETCGLTRKQIDDWFVNARRRLLPNYTAEDIAALKR